MKNRLKKNSGSALVTVLVVMMIMMVLGTSILSLSVNENRFAKSNENQLQAYYVARSGAQAIAEYMIQDGGANAASLIGKTSDVNSQVGGGTFQVTVAEEVATNSVIITSVGNYEGKKETVKVRLAKSNVSLFDNAILALKEIEANNGQGTVITGSVSSMGGISLIDLNKAVATNGINPPPDITLPTIVPPATYHTVLGNQTAALTINVTGGETKNVFAQSLNFKNGGLTVSGNGVVHLYVQGNITLDTKGFLTAGNDAQLYVYVIGADTTITLQGCGSSNNVGIYAPNSILTWESAQPGSIFNGLIICEEAILKNNLDIQYDPSLTGFNLDLSGQGVTYSGYTWID